MSHLTPESLARLVDEPPTAAEQTHLAHCARCRDVRAGLSAQTAALAALPIQVPPDGAWEGIAMRIRDHDRRRQRLTVTVARLAAGLALFAAGAVAQYAFPNDPGAARGAGSITGTPPAVTGTPVDLISADAPATIEEATARLRVAETIYTRALLDYATLASPQPPRDPVARLATLEAIVLTTRAALERAPADPLINTYHLAAQAERESLLDQLRRRSEAGQWY